MPSGPLTVADRLAPLRAAKAAVKQEAAPLQSLPVTPNGMSTAPQESNVSPKSSDTHPPLNLNWWPKSPEPVGAADAAPTLPADVQLTQAHLDGLLLRVGNLPQQLLSAAPSTPLPQSSQPQRLARVPSLFGNRSGDTSTSFQPQPQSVSTQTQSQNQQDMPPLKPPLISNSRLGAGSMSLGQGPPPNGPWFQGPTPPTPLATPMANSSSASPVIHPSSNQLATNIRMHGRDPKAPFPSSAPLPSSPLLPPTAPSAELPPRDRRTYLGPPFNRDSQHGKTPYRRTERWDEKDIDKHRDRDASDSRRGRDRLMWWERERDSGWGYRGGRGGR
jgi:hypothetical protein